MSETSHENAAPHHRSARERQRRGPMWGCLKTLAFTFVVLGLLLLLVVGGGWLYVGSTSFAGLVRLRIKHTLQDRLGREVTIGNVRVVRSRPQRVIIDDLRIANSPGAVHPYFATARQIEITGGVDSFWGRKIRVGRVDVRDPRLYFEVYPARSTLVHNFPHWQSPPPGKYDIYHLDLGTLYVTGGAFDFLDRRHDIAALATGLQSQIRVALAKDAYEGTATSSLVSVRIQDYAPFQLDLRGGFRYTPNALTLSSIALRGRGMHWILDGNVAPLSDAVYDLGVSSQIRLERVREIFGVKRVLGGPLTLDGRLKGRAGTFALSGKWASPRLRADAYDLTAAKGALEVTDERTTVDVATANYGGGTLGAHYVLPAYNEPYPMSVDLRYDRISLEKLLVDWGMQDTGLRGGTTGRLLYHWNKDQLLEGAGSGTARLERSAVPFSNAVYPVPVGGSADFELDRGVVSFKSAALDTGATRVGFTGTLRIEDMDTNLDVRIHSGDFSELDRAGYNFAHSAGKKSYALLGLGGSGDITGSVHGRLETPNVAAHITSGGMRYNYALLGDAGISLRYDGAKSLLTFEEAEFAQEGGRLALTGTMAFPDEGSWPVFDLAIDAAHYPVVPAMAVADLRLKGIHGLGTGRLVITGSPDEGRVRFADLAIVEKDAQLRLQGDLDWAPGKGNVRFNLGVGMSSFPVGDIAAFLETGTLPATGDLTGHLRLEGMKAKLGGTGAITVKNGSIAGEPVDLVSADIAFTEGRLHATNLEVSAPAGRITGSAELGLATDEFSYDIQSGSIDLERVGLLQSFSGLLGGKLAITSSGSGTFERPDVVLQARLNEATVRGVALPAGSPPPSIDLAIRHGQLSVRANIADVLSVDGGGTLGQDLAVDGLVHIRVPDVAKLVAISPLTASLPASGHFTLDLRLGGKLSSLEALRIDGAFPDLALKLSDRDFTASRPIRIGVREGRVVFDDVELQNPGAALVVTGSASLVGDRRIDMNVRGGMEVAILQLLVPGLRAGGLINIAAGIAGTLTSPRITGSAEILDAQFRFPGFPQILDHVTGTVVFRGDQIGIDSLRASLGGGTVVVGGFIAVDGLKPQRARISLQGNGVAIRYFEGITIDGDFSLLLSGDLERMTLQGDVSVNRALYFRDLDFATAFLNVVLSRRSLVPVVGASWQDHVDLRVIIHAPGTIAVRNNIADVTLSGDVDVNGTLANPVVLGLVTLDEGGRVRLQNVDYRVVRGSVNFQNPFRIDPYFDITMEGRVSGAGFSSELESGPIDITINLTGTIDRFTPTITSDPPASDITLFSVLGFGGTGGSTPGVSPQNLGQSLLLQGLNGIIGNRILPFADTFTIDPGLLDTSGDPGTKVTIEKRVSDSIRVLVIYNLQRAHSRALVEWQVTPDWTLQFTRDEVRKEYRAEARFRRRYEGQWTWGGNGLPVTMVAAARPLDTAQVPAQQAPEAGAAAAPQTAPAVREIHYRADADFDPSALSQYLSLKPGQPLSIRAVQSSIRSLFATGDFRDVRVESAPVAGGVDITFVFSLNYRIATIRFEGLRGAGRNRVDRGLTVRTGDVLSLNAVDRSSVAVQQYLQRSGYLEATVDPETNFVRPHSRADVILHVEMGPRARVGVVTVDGELAPFTAATLIGQMKNGPGRTFLLPEARNDAGRMERFMIRRDHRKAGVSYAGSTYDKASHAVALRYAATAGPIVKVEVAGVPRGAVRRALPFSKNQAYSEDIIDTAADNIARLYQERGWFNATVDTESRRQEDTWITRFNVHPGEHFRLEAVTFTGHAGIPEKTLRTAVQTAPAGAVRSLVSALFRRPAGVPRAQLAADRDALESTYRLSGFAGVQVGTPVVSTSAATGLMRVDFPITEGPQTIVRDVRIEGNGPVPLRQLPRLLLKAGQPLNPQTLRADLVSLQSFYADRGNPEAQVTPRPDISSDRTSATITYVISGGPKIHLGDVIVRGNTYTGTEVVLRKSELAKGNPFSYTSILEAQRNLYRLGMFQRVEMKPELPGASGSDRGVVIQVEEGKNLTIAGSVGATKQSDLPYSLLGSASIAHRNLFGTGRYLGLQLVGSHQRTEAFLSYREPFLGPYNVPVQLTVFQSDERRPSAHIVQRGASIEGSMVARLQTRWSLRYEYRIGDCRVENRGDLCAQAEQAILPGLDRSITDISIASITPTFFWDRRDDPIDPRRGFFTTASVEYAFPLFSADANFFKEYVQAAYYFPVSSRSVLAVSGRLGLIQTIGEVNVGGVTQRRPIPYTERFTAGGANSHRAYPLDMLGTLCSPTVRGCNGTLIKLLDENGEPAGSLAPIGGSGLFVANFEYRFPIVSSVGGSIFTDVGNVYATPAIRLDDLRWGVGTGIRYVSPVGPLRFDIGYKLRRRDYEKPFAYFITLGYAF